MKNMSAVVVVIGVSMLAGTTFGAEQTGTRSACSTGSVMNVADSTGSVAGEVAFDEGDLAILKLIATSITPVGSASESTSQTEAGRTVRTARQLVSVYTALGTTQQAEVSCEHQGCVDPDCQVSGCDPVGLDCTPPQCLQTTNQCGTTTQLGCKKKVTKRAPAQW